MSFDPRNYVPRADELAGRVIAVTGASDGIGRAVALRRAEHGAQVILIGRNRRQARGGARADRHAGGAGAGDRAARPRDGESRATTTRLADAVQERYGRLDGLRAQRGGSSASSRPIEHYDVPTWCRVLHVNLTAAFALTQVLLPALRASADASVLFTSSSVGRRGRAYWGAYAVSKFGRRGARAGARR